MTPLKVMSTYTGKAWTAINRLLIKWKSDLSDKIKQGFFQALAVSVILYSCTTWTFNETVGEKARWELHKDAVCSFNQIL